MRGRRLGRFLTPALFTVVGLGAMMWWHGRLMGQGSQSGQVTWSGRIRVDQSFTEKAHCQRPENCEDQGYGMWLPQAGETESDAGDFIDVKVVARERGKPGSKPPQEVVKYTIRLVDVPEVPGWPSGDTCQASCFAAERGRRAAG